MNENIQILVGRLARKPELKGYSKSDGTEGFRCFFRVAVTRLGDLGKPRAEQRVGFFPVVCWGNLAQRCAQYLDVGTEVTVKGELEQRVEKLEDGTYKEYFHIRANTVQFGRKSLKNSSPEDISGQLTAMQTRLQAMVEGANPTEIAGANIPSTQGQAAAASTANPFDTPTTGENETVTA